MRGRDGEDEAGGGTGIRPSRFSSEGRPGAYAPAPDPGRHATWLELFFDLVFVFAVAELGHYLHGHLTPGGLLGFLFLFVPVWRIWMAFSYHADIFGDDRPGDQAATVAAMFGVVVLGLTIYGALGGGSAGFAAAYAALRLLLVGRYAATWRTTPSETRGFVGRYAGVYAVVAALWVVSVFVPEPWRFGLWGVAVLVDLAAGPLVYLTTRSRPTQVSHMSERFGLFVIIVLGESIIAVGSGIADTDWRWQGVVAGTAGFLSAVGMWWLYFDKADESVINRSVRSQRRGILLSFVYGYGHYLIYAGITAASIGILVSIEEAQTGALSLAGRLALCGGISVFLLGVLAAHAASPRPLHGDLRRARLLGAVLLVALAIVGGVLPPAALAVGASLLLTGLVVFELRHAKTATKKRYG